MQFMVKEYSETFVSGTASVLLYFVIFMFSIIFDWVINWCSVGIFFGNPNSLTDMHVKDHILMFKHVR